MRRSLRLVVLLGVLPAVHGQESPAAKLRFEAASVRRSAPGVDHYGVRVSPSTMIYTGITLKLLIRTVWRLQDIQISGGPSWLDTARFDITAKMDKPHPPQEMIVMLRDLLEDRFQLVVATESRVQPHYSLVPVSPREGKYPGLVKASEDECRPQEGQIYQGGQGAPPPALDPVCGGVRTKVVGNAAQFAARSIPMWQFALVLTGVMNSWVEDRTALTGNYDIRFSWPIGPGASPGSEGVPPDATFIFAPLQNELGLKLEPVKGPVPVYVVQRAEMPADN